MTLVCLFLVDWYTNQALPEVKIRKRLKKIDDLLYDLDIEDTTE